MAFFPRNFHTKSDSSFHPLFRLLDDFDNYSRQDQHGRRSGLVQWQPKFDIRETEDAYELHGEFPGISKEDVHIEFTEPQTMTIRGKTERTYTSGTPPVGLVEDQPTSGAITEGTDEAKESHKATVEDEDDDENTGEEKSAESTQQVEEKKKQQAAPVDKAKYWLTERSIGEFSRSFTFPTRVEHDSVTANFKDGVLNITVPKTKRHETRRISVN